MEWWVWLLLIIVLIVVVLAIWWWWRQSQQSQSQQSQSQQSQSQQSQSLAPRVPAAAPPARVPTERYVELAAPEAPEANDLAVIEGIGPRIHDVLHEAGIRTFTQLAETPVERIREILVAAELSVPADPSTWPAQARLAADSKWQELEQLKKSLKAGV